MSTRAFSTACATMLLLLGARLPAQGGRTTSEAATVSSGATHPLDELTAAEIRSTVDILRAAGRVTPQLRFGTIELHEPMKTVVLEDLKRGVVHRSADVTAFDWSATRSYRGVVDLSARTVTFWDTLTTRRPSMLLTIRRLEEAVTGDERWLRALRRHGFDDPARVAIYGISAEIVDSVRQGRRHLYVSATAPLRDAPRPPDEIPGLLVHVDLTDAKIVALVDSGPAAMPAIDTISARALARARAVVRTDTASAADTSIRVRGSEIRWGRWRLHAGVHPRRGLEIWNVEVSDEGRWRSVLYRSSLVDMVAPYGDPAYGSFYPDDEQAFGLLAYTRNSVIAGGDVPAGARFVAAAVPDALGRPVEIPRALGLYEIVDGSAWRHADDARLARRLVLTSVATIDNYDYTFSYTLSEDGTIDVDVRLTGVMNMWSDLLSSDTAGMGGGHRGDGDHRHLVAAHVYAPNHQHFFSYRLDFDIDGADGNRVVESNTEPDPISPDNPNGEWFTMRSRVLESELAARRFLDPATSRRWRVENPHVTNETGQPVAYSLIPGENSPPYAAPMSAVRQIASYLDAQLWVTAYSPDEMYPGRTYDGPQTPFAGLATWTLRDRPLHDTDVVLWYTLGVTHLPRPEDFPFMAAHRTGFRLVPTGFFQRNPALDAAKPAAPAP